MRLLILLVVLIAVAAVIQAERNHCHWDGSDRALEWSECLIR